MTKAEIRAATPADLPALLDLYRHLHPTEAPPDLATARASFDRLTALPGSAILLALTSAPPVASVTLAVLPNLTRGGAPYGLIENVVTHSDHRRQGLATQLLHHATTTARSMGCYKIMLMTGSTRPSTLAFYRNAGFEQTKTGFQVRLSPP